MTQPNFGISVPSGKFSIVDSPIALPGVCVVCGSAGGIGGDGRKFIDFGYSLDFYGQFYFCTHCFTEPLNALSWANPEQTESLLKQVNSQAETISRLEAENVVLRGTLDQLKLLGVNVSDTVTSVPIVSHSPETIELEGSADTKPVEQSNKSGLSDVLDDVEDSGDITDIDDL